jgi:FKBP-type peptidyl-prolyl cis-trans isomerase 2
MRAFSGLLADVPCDNLYIGPYYNRAPGVQMESPPKTAEKRDTRKIVMALLIAAIVISIGAISFVVYSNSRATKSLTLPAIKAGDKVMMNYIGRFADGRVFDTSLASVGANNALYPKSLTYTSRSNDSYAPFNMTAGNYGEGGTIRGFALGVIGLHQGDRAIIDVKPADAYPVKTDYVQEVKVHQQIPVIEAMTDLQFTSSFGTDPVVGQFYEHFFWGWDVVVVSDQAGIVYIRQDPTIGQVLHPFGNPSDVSNPSGWSVTVDGYDPSAFGGQGSIDITHGVSQADVYEVKGVDIDGSTFVLSGFNSTAGTFQLSKSDSSTGYNGEIAGRELFFEVTILKVTSA